MSAPGEQLRMTVGRTERPLLDQAGLTHIHDRVAGEPSPGESRVWATYRREAVHWLVHEAQRAAELRGMLNKRWWCFHTEHPSQYAERPPAICWAWQQPHLPQCGWRWSCEPLTAEQAAALGVDTTGDLSDSEAVDPFDGVPVGTPPDNGTLAELLGEQEAHARLRRVRRNQ